MVGFFFLPHPQILMGPTLLLWCLGRAIWVFLPQAYVQPFQGEATLFGGGSNACPTALDPHLCFCIWFLLSWFRAGFGVPSLIPSKGWGEVLREEVQSIALGIQSYSDTEFLMHLVLYNKLCFTHVPVAVNGVKGRTCREQLTCS